MLDQPMTREQVQGSGEHKPKNDDLQCTTPIQKLSIISQVILGNIGDQTMYGFYDFS